MGTPTRCHGRSGSIQQCSARRLGVTWSCVTIVCVAWRDGQIASSLCFLRRFPRAALELCMGEHVGYDFVEQFFPCWVVHASDVVCCSVLSCSTHGRTSL